jgi:hypothetical protein
MIRTLRRFKEHYNKEVYEESVSAPQLHQAFNEFKWPGDKENPSFIKNYIVKYDTNFDGRLSPRELILASIFEKPYYIGSGNCIHCYKKISDIVNIIFTYLDCNEDGYISAEEMWHNLSVLKRNTEKFNIFSFGNDENIRTAAINDFILKNMKVKEGFVNRTEFLSGILLGYWDRQTDSTSIYSDDTKTLKSLRWKDNDMVDIKLRDYYKNLAEHTIAQIAKNC